MAFPTTGIIDSGTRANENPLATASSGATWSTVDRSGFGAGARLKIVSNQILAEATSECSQYITSATYGPDTEAYYTVQAIPRTIGVMLRMQAPGTGGCDGYLAHFSGISGAAFISRTDDLIDTQLGASISTSFAASDQFGADIVGSTITVYKNGAALDTRTDATYGAAGNIGLLYNSSLTNAATNFGGGTIAGGPSPTVPNLIVNQGARW